MDEPHWQPLLRFLGKSHWRLTPREQVFTICLGMDEFIKNVGSNAMYVMGISPWDKSLEMSDNAVG